MERFVFFCLSLICSSFRRHDCLFNREFFRKYSWYSSLWIQARDSYDGQSQRFARNQLNILSFWKKRIKRKRYKFFSNNSCILFFYWLKKVTKSERIGMHLGGLVRLYGQHQTMIQELLEWHSFQCSRWWFLIGFLGPI